MVNHQQRRKGPVQYPVGVIRSFNSPIFALFVLVQFDNVVAAKVLNYVREFDRRGTGKLKVQDFGDKFGGKQKYTLPVLYLLFFRHYDRAGKDNAAYDLMHQGAVVELLASAIYDVYAPHFLFLCFLFQLLTIDEGDYLEYLFWLLTKGERTLDRGDIAMMLQMVLGDKKDAFVTQHKDAIERIFVEQGSEAIVLNRFQVINASLSGIFTRIFRELQQTLLHNLFGSPKQYRDLLVNISDAFYTQPGAAYDRIRFHKSIAANRTVVHQRKEVRKEIRTILRLMRSYYHLKENTTLMFKNNGTNFLKMVQGFFGRFYLPGTSAGTTTKRLDGTSTGSADFASSTASLQGLQQAAELAKQKKKRAYQPPTNAVLKWLDETLVHGKQATEADELLKEMAELPEEALDPFKFEEDFAYTLDLTEYELFHDSRQTRKQGRRRVAEVEELLAEIQEEMDMTFSSLGLSTRETSRRGGFGSFLSARSGGDGDTPLSTSRRRGGGSFHLPQELLDRQERLHRIHETLDDNKRHPEAGGAMDDEEDIMRAVQDLGKRYEEQQKRGPRRSSGSQKRRKSSIFESLGLGGRSRKAAAAGDGDDDASSDEDLQQAATTGPTRSALATGGGKKKKKNKRVSISLDDRVVEVDDDEDRPEVDDAAAAATASDGTAAAAGDGASQSSRRKAALLSDIEQAKSMEKLSSMLSSSASTKGGGGSTKASGSTKRPTSSSGRHKPASTSGDDERATTPSATAEPAAGGGSAFSRLNQWKARKQQPKADTAVEQESQQIDTLRDMLMVDAPDEDELNEAANEALNAQLQTPEGLAALLATTNPLDGGIPMGPSAEGSKVSTILATKNAQGRFNLTEEQQFALETYNYEQGVTKQMDQEAYFTMLKRAKK